MQKMSNEFYQTIDVMKALGIISVVIGHYNGAWKNFLYPHWYHMPLFFLIGGLVAKESIRFPIFFKNILVRYFLYIVFTYVLVSLFTLFLHEFFSFNLGTPFFLSSFQDALLMPFRKNLHSSPYVLSIWFLWAYMFVVFLGRILIFYLKDKLFLLCLGIIFVYLGIAVFSPIYIKTKLQFYNVITQVLVGLGFYFTGYFLKFYISLIKIIPIIIGCILVLICHSAGVFYGFGMSWSRYSGNPIAIYLCGTILCVLIMWMASKLHRIRVLGIIGKYSKAIMSYHLLVFLCISLIIKDASFILKNPLVNPTFTGSDFIYVGLGILVPVVLGIYFDSVISFFTKK